MEQDPRQKPDAINQEYYAAVINTINRLIDQASEPLYLEEEEEAEDITGRLHEITEGEGRLAVKVGVARYEEGERERMAVQIRDMGFETVNPWGHIELFGPQGQTTVNGTLYILENNRIEGSIECRAMHEDELLDEDSTACFDFLDGLGLGRVWHDYVMEGRQQYSPRVELDDRRAMNLVYYLETHQGQTT